MKRILVAGLMAAMLTMTVYAQRSRGLGPPEIGPQGAGAPGPRQGLRPAQALKDALELTDAQVEAIRALMQTRHERARGVAAEIRQNRQVLDSYLNAASPDPTAVGTAAVALRASQNKLDAERDWFISELKKLLTGDQQQRLDEMLAANARAPLLGMLGLGGAGGRGGPEGGWRWGPR